MSVVDPALVQAYQEACYLVENETPIELKIGQASAALQALMRQHGVAGAAYITAWNPYSERHSEAVNVQADAALASALSAAGYPALRTTGLDLQGDWPQEPGWLVLGITPEEARRFGSAYRQNAVLWAGSDGVPALLMLR